MSKKSLFAIFLLFIYLLLCPQMALNSAREGLLLWYHSVLPVVFPFLFLSSLAIRLVSAEDMPKILTRPFTRLFGCSAYGAFVIPAGFLCGFPMGAKLTGDLYRDGKITREEALRLFGFANNLSPGFIVSYLAAEQMQQPALAGCFLLQILGAALLYGWTQGWPHHVHQHPAPQQTPRGHEKVSFSLIDDCIYGAMESALRLGAYILLFAILSGAITQAAPLSNPAILLFASSIEVTNGIRLLAASALSAGEKYVAVSALAAFGGFSALAQSAGIAHMDKEMLFYYIKSRVIITLLSILISIAVFLLLQAMH
ncbi:MAG: hypothetical protein LUD12_14340 [Lachnospiraceae bacterium]|nr:hypothetical protein [Lachnospiraceae bacterium]